MKKTYLGFDKNFNLRKIEFKGKPKGKTDNILLAKYANIGYYLVTPVIVGVFLGLLADRRFGAHGYVVWGIMIGGIGTFYNLFRLLRQ